MVEDLDDLGSCDHLLDIAVGDGELLLLADEVFGAVAADHADNAEHGEDPEDDDDGHLPAQDQHHDEDGNDGDDGVDHLRDGL